MAKFMQVLEPHVFKELERVARKHGVTIQELIRVRMIPDFLYGPIKFDKKTVKRMLNGDGRDSRQRRNR